MQDSNRDLTISTLSLFYTILVVLMSVQYKFVIRFLCDFVIRCHVLLRDRNQSQSMRKPHFRGVGESGIGETPKCYLNRYLSFQVHLILTTGKIFLRAKFRNGSIIGPSSGLF